MEIKEVNVYDLRYPLVEPFANSQAWSKTRTAGVVEIVTDAGITGWGEGLHAPNRSAIASRLIGRDPFDVEVIWHDLYARGWGDIAAMSAVERICSSLSSSSFSFLTSVSRMASGSRVSLAA